ncbi:MAG: hypothetical protein WCE54_08860 [Ignavibacteriaceae bacterium]
MRRNNIYIIAGILIISAFIFSFLYIFNIYEVNYTINPQTLYADSRSIATVSSKPVNAFGWKTPFRTAPADFEIKEGNDLADIISEDNKKGVLILKAKNKPGKIILYVKSRYALLPSSIEINILPK